MGEVTPVIAGLAVGVALIVLFASIFGTVDRSFTDNRNEIDIVIQGLKDNYASGERIALTVHINGFTDRCDSTPRIKVINSDSGDILFNYRNLGTFICFGQFNLVDTTLTTEGPDNELGDIIVNKNGNYKIVVEQYGENAEGEFSVAGSPSTQDAHDFAVRITKNLDETKEFFDTYPNANTTVYFITTCPDESCSTLWRIPSVVEYWYKAEDQRYAELRITIDYEEGRPTFSQLNCSVYGTEDKNVGMYGALFLEGVAEFLNDSQCPDS